MIFNVCLILFNLFIASIAQQCSLPNNNYRLDCFPGANANQNDCIARGCCWSAPQYDGNRIDPTSIPYCYFPNDYPSYQIKSLTHTDRGLRAILTKQQKSFLPKEILNLNFEAIYETDTRIRIRITDSNTQRFEVPIKLDPPSPSPPTNKNYHIIMPSNGSFTFEVKRHSDGLSLIHLFGPLLYSDQFIQISTFLSTDQIYGIGEQNRPFLHNLSKQWSRIAMWGRDNAIDTYNNLYGTHPFYMAMTDSGKSYGVYTFNSNAQEFDLQPIPAITYRTTGGILDIFIFTGETPEETVQQYQQLIGKPMLPPYWSLGFHLTKYGYKSIGDITNILTRNIKAGVPIDVHWSDIDYMDNYKDFTFDPINYPNFGKFITQLKETYGTRYIVIIDPGISNQSPGKYPPYDDGMQMNVFIKDPRTNQPLIGNVWPGDTVYPDFTHPNITQYWSKQIATFYNSIPVDGLWIDMNEPANFYEGSKYGCPSDNSYDYPFFLPPIRDYSLIRKSICPSSLHYNNTMHYNLHNLYGYFEALVTYNALVNTIRNKRVFLLSRSTFSGSGKYTFHWTGDNFASWDQLSDSIRQILSFNMFGIPMTGADICGFIWDSTEELCIRWMQLGAFYPFMRNHNIIYARDQDPASWSNYAQNIMKSTIYTRYALSPLYYTLLVKSHLYGGTVMRPLGFEFYNDTITHDIEQQFMIGSSLLVNPVVKQGATSVLAYFPAGNWYDMSSFTAIQSSDIGKWINLDAPLDKINFAIRGGHILTFLQPGKSIELTRKNSFVLFCALSRDHTAVGDLYWDDGESLDSYTSDKYSHIMYTANSSSFVSTPDKLGYSSIPPIMEVIIAGLNYTSINTVNINNKPVQFQFDNKANLLVIEAKGTSLSNNIFITWK